MKRKTIMLIIGLVLMLVSLNIGIITAQSPTEEPDTVVVAPEGSEVSQPETGVTVVQVPVEDGNFTDIAGILAIILSSAVALAALLGQYLNTAQRQKLLSYAEVGEDQAWKIAATTSQIISALGGKKDVLVSSDPAEIAKALHDKDTHVFISRDVDFDLVLREYATPPTV